METNTESVELVGEEVAGKRSGWLSGWRRLRCCESSDKPDP